MYDIEHDFSISRICVDWIEMVKRLEDVIIISYVRAGSGGDRKNARLLIEYPEYIMP